MKTNATEIPKMTNKTYRVTQRVTVEMVVDVEATSVGIAKQKACEWSPTIWEGYEEKNSYWDENNDLEFETFALAWEITDIKDIDQREVTEMDGE